MSAILLCDGKIIRFKSAVDMVREVMTLGGDVLAFYIAGSSMPAQAQTATKEQQDMIFEFSRLIQTKNL